jgi:hypothetical protein
MDTCTLFYDRFQNMNFYFLGLIIMRTAPNKTEILQMCVSFLNKLFVKQNHGKPVMNMCIEHIVFV